MGLNSVGAVYAYSNSVNLYKNTACNLSTSTNESTSGNRDYRAFSEELQAAKNPTVEPSAAEKPSSETEQKTLAEMIREQMEKIDNMFSKKETDKSSDTKLGFILRKFNTGLTLTAAEQQYLALKDPDTYSSYQKIHTVRSMYKSSLGACSTRDQVNSMRLTNSLSALAEYKKSAKNGGNGMDIVRLNAALESEMRDYVRSGNYQRLPTAAECNKFDAELAKARKYEREKQLENRLERLAPKAKHKKKANALEPGRRTVAQVMSSPLGRKVLASRKKSYGGSGFGIMNFKI